MVHPRRLASSPDRPPRGLGLALATSLAVLLAACGSTPHADTSALPATPAAFQGDDSRWTTAPPADAQPRGEWWRVYADPTLDALVAQAGERSSDIQAAAARLAQAEAQLHDSNADRHPQLGVNAGAQRGTNPYADSLPRPLVTQVSLGAELSYELDLFGRLASASQAAALDAQARQALLQDTRLLVQSRVAQTYLALRATDEELALVQDTVQSYQQTEHLVGRRLAAGDVSELDLMRIRTEVAATEADALALQRRRQELEHALATLVGDTASGFHLPAMGGWQLTLPRIPAGVPATVLSRRPDVAAAQRSLLAAQSRIGVARAAWFPRLALTAAGGYAAPELDDVLNWSARSWGLGALLSLPVFDGGRREAAERLADARFDEAAATYRASVLQALQEVEDQLGDLQWLAQQADAQARAVDAATRASALSGSRYRNGLISQLDLLDAQRSELLNRRQAVQVRAAQMQASVGLIRALGGGWGPAPEAVATAAR